MFTFTLQVAHVSGAKSSVTTQQFVDMSKDIARLCLHHDESGILSSEDGRLVAQYGLYGACLPLTIQGVIESLDESANVRVVKVLQPAQALSEINQDLAVKRNLEREKRQQDEQKAWISQ